MIKPREKIIIAIDGYSSCGKSSFAKLIALGLGYIYIDSGAMYRAVSLYALRNKLIIENKVDREKLKKNLSKVNITFSHSNDGIITLLNGENIENEIRGVEVSSVVSEISKIAEVRQRLSQLQEQMGKYKGLVMDGRDIGTVIFPHAEIKIFMKADTEVRAKRRYDELLAKGLKASLNEITENIEERDYQDVNRDVSPLRQAKDAIVLDNSFMTFNEQMKWFERVLVDKGLIDGHGNNY